ncbi:MAG: hypothetical protein WC454_04355, partial [Phycisphaerae bacterium]
MKNVRIISHIISLSLLVLCPLVAHGTSFTLSDDALMSLDYDFPYHGMQSEITSITNVAGPGVRFDILYPDPLYVQGQMPTVSWTS